MSSEDPNAWRQHFFVQARNGKNRGTNFGGAWDRSRKAVVGGHWKCGTCKKSLDGLIFSAETSEHWELSCCSPECYAKETAFVAKEVADAVKEDSRKK